MNNNINKKLDYFLVFSLILLSGSPSIYQPILYGILGVISFIYSLQRYDKRERKDLWLYITFLAIIFTCQYIVLDLISVLGSINVIGKIVLGATIMWKLKERFRETYLNCMYFFAIISLVFFTLKFIGITIPNIFPTTQGRHSILIYTDLINSLRNSGPFWEPGAYSCYILLVPLLYIDNLRDLLAQHKRKVIILAIALLTTLSTTGYIGFAIVLLYHSISITKNKIIAYIIYLPLTIGVTYYLYNSLDFLSNKIEEQTIDAISIDNEFSNTRMGSLMFDLYYIEKHPIIGNGLHEKTRFADHKYLWGETLGHGNAFSNYTAQMGVLAMLLYLILIYKKFNRNIIAPIIIVCMLQGEQLLNYPLFLALPFVILYKTRTNNIIINKDEKSCSNHHSIQ